MVVGGVCLRRRVHGAHHRQPTGLQEPPYEHGPRRQGRAGRRSLDYTTVLNIGFLAFAGCSASDRARVIPAKPQADRRRLLAAAGSSPLARSSRSTALAN